MEFKGGFQKQSEGFEGAGGKFEMGKTGSTKG